MTDLLVQRVLGHQNIIVSGEFGMLFSRVYKALFRSIIVADGGLRNTTNAPCLNKYASLIERREFVFVDDSFYSGVTRNRVRSEVYRLGGRVRESYVIYDGSPNLDRSVSSLYRYHGHGRSRIRSQTHTSA